MRRPVGRVGLVVVLAGALAAFSPLLARAQDALAGTVKDQLIGGWELVSVTTRAGGSTFAKAPAKPVVPTQPYGAKPSGALRFERDGRFASTIVHSDGKSVSEDRNRPAEFEAAAGTYSMHPSQPKMVIFEIAPTGDRKRGHGYVAITTLTAKELEFQTLPPPGGGPSSTFVYRRAP